MDHYTLPAEAIVNANAVFCALAKEKMPVPLAYKIMKWCKAVEADVEFYGERFRLILEECSDGCDEEGNFRVSLEHQQELTTKLEELRKTEMSCPRITFSIEELSAISITPAEMASLDPFIKE